MSIKFRKVKINKNNKFIYDRNNYYIENDGIIVGHIQFVKRNKVLFINGIYIDEEYQRQGIGMCVIEYILNHYDVDYIIGESVNQSKSFWTKVIKRFQGFRRNIHYSDNCSSTFIIPKNKTNLNKYNNLSSNTRLYKFIEKCTNT